MVRSAVRVGSTAAVAPLVAAVVWLGVDPASVVAAVMAGGAHVAGVR